MKTIITILFIIVFFNYLTSEDENLNNDKTVKNLKDTAQNIRHNIDILSQNNQDEDNNSSPKYAIIKEENKKIEQE